LYDTHTAQEQGSLFWPHALMRLQFNHVHSFFAEAGCETGKRFVSSLVVTS